MPAIFTVVRAALLGRSVHPDPSRLVALGDRDADGLPVNIGFRPSRDLRDQSPRLRTDGRDPLVAPTLVTAKRSVSTPCA